MSRFSKRCIAGEALLFAASLCLSGLAQGMDPETVRASIQPSSTESFVAPVPPMGWNSYDAFRGSVNEWEVKANADYMAEHLAQYGWEYVVVDFYWYFPDPIGYAGDDINTPTMDGFGRLLPDPVRFPSSAGGQGFKPLADYVHSKGLKFGIHIMRGIPRAAVWANTPVFRPGLPPTPDPFRAQDVANTDNISCWSSAMYGTNGKALARIYYDSIVDLYANWGVDYIKADDMSFADQWCSEISDETYHQNDIEALYEAIVNGPRSMVLSLSPGPTPLEKADHVRNFSQLWRISKDLWDDRGQLTAMFPLLAAWADRIAVGPDQWPDADMLPLGHLNVRDYADDFRDEISGLSDAEQRALMTLWVISRSPLMIGGNLPDMDAFPDVLSLLTNEEVLAVNQASENARELFRDSDSPGAVTAAWLADVPPAGPWQEKYLAVFDLDGGSVGLDLATIGVAGRVSIRDLWAKRDLGFFRDRFNTDLAGLGAGLYKVVENRPPDCATAYPSEDTLWPPNHKFRTVQVLGIGDPENDSVTVSIQHIFQDEPVETKGAGRSTPDARGIGKNTAQLRAERSGRGNGRVYHIGFRADDGYGGQCTGEVLVGVPHDRSRAWIDDGALFNSM